MGGRWTRRCDDRVIGIELEQLKRVPRAIAVAGGPGKTEAIHAALVGGWINCLITDTYTAKRLLEMGADSNKTKGLEEEIVEHAIGSRDGMNGKVSPGHGHRHRRGGASSWSWPCCSASPSSPPKTRRR